MELWPISLIYCYTSVMFNFQVVFSCRLGIGNNSVVHSKPLSLCCFLFWNIILRFQDDVYPLILQVHITFTQVISEDTFTSEHPSPLALV